MRFKKAILGVAIGSAALTGWAAGPEFGPGLFGMGGEGRGGQHATSEGHPRGHARGEGHGRGEGHRRGEDHAQGEGHGHRHGHGHGGPGRAGAGEQTPERAAARAERMAASLVSSVDGTPEQKEKISAIAKAAAQDLVELRKQSGDLRRQGMDLLKAPTIDRNAIEALRSRQIAAADAVSKRLSTALADTAEVLTPEQRVQLAERMQSHRGKRG